MQDLEVWIELYGQDKEVGRLRVQHIRGREHVTFSYHSSWLEYEDRFSLEPALQIGEG